MRDARRIYVEGNQSDATVMVWKACRRSYGSPTSKNTEVHMRATEILCTESPSVIRGAGAFNVTAYIARTHAFRGVRVDETGYICRDREHCGNDEPYHVITVGL